MAIKVDPAATQLRRELGFFTHDEVCDVLGVARGTGLNRRGRGDWPPSLAVGKNRLYPIASFQKWIARRGPK